MIEEAKSSGLREATRAAIGFNFVQMAVAVG